MFLIVGTNHDDILFYESSLKNKREEIILNHYTALIGMINNQEVMLIHDIYTSYIASSILSYIIDKYLDDCSLSSLDSVRIVHGKGTGKLRQGIHTFLKKHTHVKSFRNGTFGEGEMGVTVVELKK